MLIKSLKMENFRQFKGTTAEIVKKCAVEKHPKTNGIFLDFLNLRQTSTAEGGLPFTGCRKKCYNAVFRGQILGIFLSFPRPRRFVPAFFTAFCQGCGNITLPICRQAFDKPQAAIRPD